MASFQATLLEDSEDAVTTLHTLTLSAVIPGNDASVREFEGSCIIHDGNSTVQRGMLHREGENSLPTACKFARGDLTRLKREAKLYMGPYHLQDFQGLYVLRFFGYYEGTTMFYGREFAVGCMILEDCGRAVTLAERAVDSIKHLLHGDIEFDFRHIHINENDNAIRMIDFDHSAPHKYKWTGEIEMYNYQPSRPIFDCGELYQAFCRIGAWIPDRIRFAGRPIQIFRAPTVKRLMKMHNYLYPEDENTDVESKAQRVLDLYYRMYGPRFKTIGYPLQLKLPIGIPEVPDSDNEDEDAKMPPFQKPEWKTVTLEHA